MNTNKSSNIIDPHSLFANGENVDISDLMFFVDLKVFKRNKLYNDGGDTEGISISFLGNKTPSSNFTTLFTENEENFGIKSIDYKISSSYVPQVDIVFEDVRGQSLFSDWHTSKYRVLFDFPPPIFLLTIKGYYGQAVENRLHLLKSNTTINENGSYEIKCSFVGMTFAPLADILFDNLLVAPYLSDKSASDDTTTTLDLRVNSKSLIAQIQSAVKNDNTVISEKLEVEKNLDIYARPDFINVFKERLKDDNCFIEVDKGKKILKVKTKWFNSTQTLFDVNEKWRDASYDKLNKVINNTIEDLKDIENNPIKPFPKYSSLPAFTGDTGENLHTIYEVNLSDLEFQVKKYLNKNADELKAIEKRKNETTNAVVLKVIKGGPTLRNILNILLGDALKYYKALEQVVKNTEGKRDSNLEYGEDQKYTFPKYVEIETSNGSAPANKVLTLPPDDWEEVKFVDSYISGKLKSETRIKNEELTIFNEEDLVNYKYLPINPFDSLMFTPANIYVGEYDLTTLKSIIVQRATVLSKQTFIDPSSDWAKRLLSFGKYIDKPTLLPLYAKGEAYNIIESLKQTNVTLLNALIEEVSRDGFTFDKPVITVGNQIEGATKDVVYSIDTAFRISSEKDFPLGKPELRTAASSTDELTKNLEEVIKQLNASIIAKDQYIMTQYNVPLSLDKAAKEDKNTSDYFTDKIIVDSKINYSEMSANKFLEYLGQDEDGGVNDNYIKNPFDFKHFKDFAAIHEVPHIVLAWWGYVFTEGFLEKGNSNYDEQEWLKLPQALRSVLYDEYILFIENYNNHFEDFNKVTQNFDDFEEVKKTKFFEILTETKYLTIGYDYAFDTQSFTTIKINYTPNARTQEYYKVLITELKNNKQNIVDEVKKVQQDYDKATKDITIRSALYYGFKTFVDRWIVGSSSLKMEDLLNSDKSFIMVDRAFNDIGDRVMLDLSPITNISTADTSLYTVILNLLAKNNFEFFALPSYVDYSSSSNGVGWTQQNVEKIFGTHDTLPQTSNPKFICMYVGGTSSQLDMPQLREDSLSFGDDGGSIDEIEDLTNNGHVQAFELNFGTQNQSFFTKVELDQAEFKETNESINMLDEIVKRGGSEGELNTVTKGNNLLNVYEQRSYSCGVTSLGNMMIQPTMYFDLKNIAMWKGAYLILETSHHIEPNNMTTSFKGVRVPKYSKPYVTDYSVLVDGTTTSSSRYGGSQVYRKNSVINADDKADLRNSLDKIGVITTEGLSDKEKAFLDVLGYAEGTVTYKGSKHNGYDVINGFTLIPAWKPNYGIGHQGKLTDPPIAGAWRNKTDTSGASGRYQIQWGTWVYSTSTEKDKNLNFNMQNQDNRAKQIFTEKLKSKGFSVNEIDDRKKFTDCLNALSKTWVSLPTHSVTELWIVFTAALRKYLGNWRDSQFTELLNSELDDSQLRIIENLHSDVQDIYKKFIISFQEATDYYVIVKSGYRGLAEQTDVVDVSGANVPAGNSMHNYGLALDVKLAKKSDKTKVVIDSHSSASEWVNSGLVKYAEAEGLNWGGTFRKPDVVHFYYNGKNGEINAENLLSKARNKFPNLNGFDGRKIDLG